MKIDLFRFDVCSIFVLNLWYQLPLYTPEVPEVKQKYNQKHQWYDKVNVQCGPVISAQTSKFEQLNYYDRVKQSYPTGIEKLLQSLSIGIT